jgi:flagellar protein FlaG
MSMEVNPVLRDSVHVPPTQFRSTERSTSRERSSPQSTQAMGAEIDIDKLLGDLQSVTQVFNRRLQFSVNGNLDELVVKVIDKTTDTVIKEIPPAELQRMHTRIREAIGLFIDETI